ncbi:U2 snRNP complex subunit [Polyrhizophydium stewartii]|uniref:U2 small nuclear ribonucleoprotein A' n=1 Tax=Polyrhizophydium stewartii TaxID=2732419 RepID=A0ABR4MY27_9FUNG
MPRLDFDLLAGAQSRINPAGDRELRGLDLQRIEDLSLTQLHCVNPAQQQDKSDALGLTDNDLRCLDNLTNLSRLKTILGANNRTDSLGFTLRKCIPSLRMRILANNHLAQLGDLDTLLGLKHLEVLWPIDNRAESNKLLKSCVIRRCPKVRVIGLRSAHEREDHDGLALLSGKKDTARLKSLFKTAAMCAAEVTAAATSTGDAVFTSGKGVPGVF